MGFGTARGKAVPRVPLRHGEGNKGHLTSFGGLAALSLDALSSVAYGPEAIVLVLAAAGTAALRLALPVTLAIVGLLVVLVVSYCQVIAVHPDGGGAYAVGKKDLGATVSLLAAASLVVDYVLTVAVSLAAGAASLASAFPPLQHHLLAMCLAGLIVITAVNLWGIAESARVLMLPMVVFLAAIFGVIVIGLVRSHPAAIVGTTQPVRVSEAVGVILILKAFAAGCSALTGIEAIANGVPVFREPRARRAQRTELMLGALLGAMLIGLAVLIRREHVAPRGGVTVLAQLTAGSFGTGWAYYRVWMWNSFVASQPTPWSATDGDIRVPVLRDRSRWEKLAPAGSCPLLDRSALTASTRIRKLRSCTVPRTSRVQLPRIRSNIVTIGSSPRMRQDARKTIFNPGSGMSRRARAGRRVG